MAVTLEQVTVALMPDEPRYGRLVTELGADALPHLATLIQGDNLALAAKAASLATLIKDKRSLDVLSHAVASEHEVVRISAAAGLWRLEQFGIGPLLEPLLLDAQPSVRLNAAKSAVRGADGPAGEAGTRSAPGSRSEPDHQRNRDGCASSHRGGGAAQPRRPGRRCLSWTRKCWPPWARR